MNHDSAIIFRAEGGKYYVDYKGTSSCFENCKDAVNYMENLRNPEGNTSEQRN